MEAVLMFMGWIESGLAVRCAMMESKGVLVLRFSSFIWFGEVYPWS